MVLIVEDDEYKATRINRVVGEVLDSEVQVLRDCNTALSWMKQNHCDILILDLCIPVRFGENPDIQNGLTLLSEMQRADSKCNIPHRIVGLSAFAEGSPDLREHFEQDGWILIKYENSSNTWTTSVKRTLERELSVMRSVSMRGAVIALHGIRTFGHWHKTLSDICFMQGWYCPTDGWWYGRFSVFSFLLGFARYSKVQWFRKQISKYHSSIPAQASSLAIPSVVAHSFGTYILGYALLKYKDIRVNRVILCGSILPRDFPWNELIQAGQVGEVINFVGKQDVWPVLSSYLVPGTGASGRLGFNEPDQIVQQNHNLAHTEYFETMQIEKLWMPFFNKRENVLKYPTEKHIPLPTGDHRILAHVLGKVVFVILLVVALTIAYGISWLFVFIVNYLFKLII
jgi:hypothetical protein